MCYCTGSNPNYVLINNKYGYPALGIPPSSIDYNGFTFTIQYYAFYPNVTQASNFVIFTVANYAWILLTNNMQTLQIGVFNSNKASTSPATYYNFPNFKFRFNFWTTITISVSTTQISLTVDGT